MTVVVSGRGIAAPQDEARLVEDFLAGRITGGLFVEVIKEYGASAAPTVRSALRQSDDPAKNASLVRALSALQAEGIEADIAQALERSGRDGREALEVQSLLALRKIPTRAAARLVLKIVRESGSTDASFHAQLVPETVGMLEGPGAIAEFIVELQRVDGLVEMSIERLGRLRAVDAALPLLPFLQNESLRMRNIAARALYRIADKRSRAALEQALAVEKDELVRMRLEAALVRMGDGNAATRLQQRLSLGNGPSEARTDAMNFLFAAKVMGMIDDLAELARDEEPLVRARAVEFLGSTGCREAIPVLQQVSREDAWGDLRQRSLEVLEALSKRAPCAFEAEF